MPDAEATPADSPEQQETPTPSDGSEPSEPEQPASSSYPPPGDCEPGLADLACTAAGDKAKTDYVATFSKDLEEAEKAYQTTRTAYRDARNQHRLEVEDLRNQIRHLVDRIGCQFEQKRVRTCLDDSFEDVLEELECCPEEKPCCPEDCEFPVDQVDPHDVAALTALITKYEARITEAKACFETLKGEPKALTDRVAAIKKAVDDINADLGGNDATLDLKKVYAKALVAQWKAKLVWGSFRQVQDFVDCLCQALTCWTKGCEAVYQLTGLKAVAECVEKRKQDHCDRLRTETVEMVLAGYDRRCGKHECKDDDCSDEPDQEEPEEDDCGCHHHHPHHPKYRHRGGCRHDDCGCESRHHECGCESHHHECGCESHHHECGCRAHAHDMKADPHPHSS